MAAKCPEEGENIYYALRSITVFIWNVQYIRFVSTKQRNTAPIRANRYILPCETKLCDVFYYLADENSRFTDEIDTIEASTSARLSTDRSITIWSQLRFLCQV